MVKVITYGTYDLLHFGHIRLLERAKALGDYLIVGVTADDFDKTRGKINVQQTLIERIKAVKDTGLADEIVVEEYEGQKIDDILRLGVDIFTVGSDWEGKFDYLNEYCKVVYLSRTKGVSSSELRDDSYIRLGITGSANYLKRVINESKYVNGIKVTGICTDLSEKVFLGFDSSIMLTNSYSALLDCCDAVYIYSYPGLHYQEIKEALLRGKHVLYESPLAISVSQHNELHSIAERKNLVLAPAIRTAYSMAYSRLLLLIKSGKIGDVISIDATCTAIRPLNPSKIDFDNSWCSMTTWGPTALLPILQILGDDYIECKIITRYLDAEHNYDLFSKIELIYPHSVASAKVGKGIKSEGELIISGTKGYVYVPAPWWKTDYFEVRYENPADNQRYFYQLEGEGIRYQLVSFVRSINCHHNLMSISLKTTESICSIMEQYSDKRNLVII